MAVVSMAISALTALVLCALVLSFARREGDAPAYDVPLLASSAIAYGGGFLHAFSVAVGALRRDRADGVRHLLVARTGSLRGYVLARVGGLAALLALEVGGGTVLVGAIAIAASTRADAVLRAAQASLAAALFALAFAAVIAPLAFAALGARTRATGYVFLLAVLVLPELLASMASGSAPSEVLELCSVPSALGALRGSLAPGAVDPLRCLRALVAVAVVAVAALAVVRRDLALLEREHEVA